MSLIHLLRRNNYTNLTACLNSMSALNAGIGIGDLFQFLETLDIGFDIFLSCTRSCRRDSISSLNQNINNAIGFNIVMMGLDGMHNHGLFAISTCKISTNHRMRTFDLVVYRLADIVQKACAFCGHWIKAKLGGHHSAEIGNFKRVIQNILTIRSAVAQSTKNLFQFRI